jgi:hypothetical protein
MKNRILILLAIIFCLFGCGSSKKAPEVQLAAQPEWVKSRLSSPTYYYGIGAARKTMDVSQYQQAARQNALADMAGEVSISISSNSVLHAFESNLNFREDFTSTIRAQAQQDLEGYELVDSWEDAGNYWVFYRLSKAHHHQLKEQRKNNAVSRSLDFFNSGLKARDEGNIRMGIVQLIKAMEPIKPYFSEPLPVDFNGQQIFLGNEIFKEISNTIASIDIRPVDDRVAVKSGNGLASSQLQFESQYRSKGSVADIPLVARYSEKPIRNNKQRTNTSGIAAFEVDIVRSAKSFESFTATLDFDELLSEAGADPYIRKLVTRFSLPQSSIRISIEKPIFAIISNEVILGEGVNPGILEESFKKKAIEAGYLVKNDPEGADYILRITAVVSPREESGQFKNVSLEGTLSVESASGNQIYHKSLEGFKGRHFEYRKAGEDAFIEARRRLEITYFREINDAIGRR